jgi:Bleomycin resistance protein-like N-terminal
MARRAGAILTVADVERSVAFYRDRIGLDVKAFCRYFCVDPDGYLVEIEQPA